MSFSYDILAKRNHKGLTVEYLYCFLNNSITIVAEERGTNNIFVPVNIATDYAWNSAPIDATDILRSISAIDREFHSHIDVSLNSLPKMT